MDVSLIIQRAPQQSGLEGQCFVLKAGKTVLGRGRSCDVILIDADRIISSQHLIIEVRESHVYVTDLSTNGTYLNSPEKALTKNKPELLQANDSLYLGGYRIGVQIKEVDISNEPLLGGSFIDSISKDLQESAPLGIDQSSDLDPLDKFLEPHSPTEDRFTSSVSERPESKNNPLDNISMDNKPADPLDILDGTTSDGFILEEVAPRDDDWWKTDSPPISSRPEDPLRHSFSPPKADIEPVSSADVPPTAGKESDPLQTDSPSRTPGLASSLGVPERTHSELEAELVATIKIAANRLIRILQARSSLKNEMRVERTVLGSRENNPLKFSANADDALKLMFSTATHGFSDGPTSFDEAIQDLEDHQLATLMGIKAAYTFMLQHFNPEKIAAQAESMGKAGSRGIGGKGRLWDFYCAHYRNLMEDTEATYNRLFGDILSKEYDTHIRSEKQKRDRSPSLQNSFTVGKPGK
ncbi:type VI secretion system-associated FHA domain protein TagH [Marinobacter sp. chi1]|uniref:Type VI secretion system-associated FHA domain protein TagH n=1 Tax=Marinobacter suaedae TaxID=3057675 RepID=A0ABT8VW06_9GAMM|nr:type VI secretion system-associated FHA domain protein TagH [Marinobacter sp. chi1]MDO3720170.1 type VI secretion system-associated FHA domain protein TagH [Marinobacter sp. chi1]